MRDSPAANLPLAKCGMLSPLSPVGGLIWWNNWDCGLLIPLKQTQLCLPRCAHNRDSVRQLTLEDVGFGCEVESDGQRDHQDGEEQQCLQGWNQGALVPAQRYESALLSSNIASSLFCSSGRGGDWGVVGDALWLWLLRFSIKAAESNSVLRLAHFHLFIYLF